MGVSRFELPGEGLLAARVCLGQRMPGGDPVRLRAAAGRSGEWAADLRRVAGTLLASADTPLWSGPAHRAFAEQIRAHTPSMSATAERYEHYADALRCYAVALEDTGPRLRATRNRLAQRCDELASRDQATVSAAAGNVGAAHVGAAHVGARDFGAHSFGIPAMPGGPPSPDTTDLLLLARDFKAGYDRWADALDRCARALSQADEADPTRDAHGLSALGHHLATAAQRHLSPYARAVLHPSLANLSDCLGSLNGSLTVLGLGLLFIYPPAGAACLAAATVLAVARLAVDTARRARGEQVSGASLGFELAAAIPIGGNAVRGLRAADNVTHLVPGGGLLAHEGLDGGHTLAKHVGKSESFLRHRLATEPHLEVASTFHNRQIAENALSRLLDVNTRGIQRWLGEGAKSLVLDGRMSHPVGVAIMREAAGPVEASGIRLVLKRSAAMTTGYRIHTAMVER
ncbi:MAG: RNase A-like domain-containing protein [Jatrophihabitantaceae bacterium]